MKKNIFITIVLTLIVLPCLSQKRFIIDRDTVIVFTQWETRKLALVLLDGDKYKKLYLTDSIIMQAKDSIIVNQNIVIKISDSTIQANYKVMTELSKENKRILKQSNRRATWNAILGGTTIGLAITLLVVLL